MYRRIIYLVFFTLLIFGTGVLAACGGDLDSPQIEDCEPGAYGENCEPCEAGVFCAGGDAEPVECGDGTWDGDGNPATECIAWTECTAGEYVDEAGSAVEDRQCAACPSGTFSTMENAEQCQSWSDCLRGEYIVAPGNRTTDRQCAECVDCSSGDEVEPMPCEEGTWDHDANQASECVPWTDCPSGQYVAQAGSATEDRVCEDCPDGQTSHGPNASSCDGSRWAIISTGSGHSCAVGEDTTLWCWGLGDFGRLGLGDTDDRHSPEQVLADDPILEKGWKSVSAGIWHTCAVRDDSTIWCWGSGDNGRLGVGDTDDRVYPEQVFSRDKELKRGWESVSTGHAHSCALRDDGTLWCWGWNWYGELGLGDRDERLTPQQVMSDDAELADGWAAISAGSNFSCALRDDTTLWCWGAGDSYRLAQGHTLDRHTPQQVEEFQLTQGWAMVSAGGGHACALRQNETIYCWGLNSVGQLGVGDTERWPFIMTILVDPDLREGWAMVSAGGGHTCAVRHDGTLWCWGGGGSGRLGLGDVDSRLAPEQVLVGDVDIDEGWKSVSGGSGHTCAIGDNGSLWCWGNNNWGQLGLGDTESRLTPERVPVR